MNNTLKPCPFCGGEAVLIKDISGRRAWHVCCNNEECFMGMGLPIWCKSEREAAKAWNTRADISPKKNREESSDFYAEADKHKTE